MRGFFVEQRGKEAGQKQGSELSLMQDYNGGGKNSGVVMQEDKRKMQLYIFHIFHFAWLQNLFQKQVQNLNFLWKLFPSNQKTFGIIVTLVF